MRILFQGVLGGLLRGALLGVILCAVVAAGLYYVFVVAVA